MLVMGAFELHMGRIMESPAYDVGRAIDLDALAELNALRAGAASRRLQQLEQEFSFRLGADRRLAVYGSLAPGRSNHDQLQALRGEWRPGLSVTGERVDRGWGAGIGYPALNWSPSGPPVAIELFVSDELPRHWPRLDDFEGADYRRIIVPVLAGDRIVSLANLYAARVA
jgi:gamma-glutamylcyclotransferase (GGCT)/AIG2-like uncharacterized protein YtfP